MKWTELTIAYIASLEGHERACALSLARSEDWHGSTPEWFWYVSHERRRAIQEALFWTYDYPGAVITTSQAYTASQELERRYSEHRAKHPAWRNCCTELRYHER